MLNYSIPFYDRFCFVFIDVMPVCKNHFLAKDDVFVMYENNKLSTQKYNLSFKTT